MARVITENNRLIRIVHESERKSFISKNDVEMDARAVEAVKAALDKAKFCKKPIAKYDIETQKAYIEYPDRGRVNV